MNENIVEIDEPIRNALIRPWSLIRCIISPKSFVSKSVVAISLILSENQRSEL